MLINVEIYYLLGIAIGCGEPTLASGVIAVEPYTTTLVGSVIFYQCQSGFTPSNASSMCEANGIWSPDPSQVVCRPSYIPAIIAGRVGVCVAVCFTFCSVIFVQVGNFGRPLPLFTEDFEVFS